MTQNSSQIPASEQEVIDKLSEMDLNLVRNDHTFDDVPNFRKPLSLESVEFKASWMGYTTQGYTVALGHIVELYFTLENSSLRTLPDIIFENLLELQNLFIAKSKIDSLPENIGNLKKLKTLNISQSQLTSLSECIGNLKNLKYLWFQGNRLHSLPENIGNLKNLEGVNLRFNNLTKLPESFKNLEFFYDLYLNENPLRSLSNINFDKLGSYSLPITHLSPKGRDLLRPFDWNHANSVSCYYFNKDDDQIERDLKKLAKYYEHSPLVLAQKYCNDPKSLSPDELERLAWEAGPIERELLESRFPPENLIIKKIVDRMKVELKNGYDILL